MERRQAALQLFCFARVGSLPDLSSLQSESLEVKPCLSMLALSNVAAVYGTVNLDDFAGPGAEQRLSDLEWVGPRAIFHEKVIEEIARRSPVLPARFGTIYISAESLESYLREHLEAISAFLESVTDKSEWAIKVYIDPERSRESVRDLISDAERQLPKSPGARYLHERRLRESAVLKFENWLGEILSLAQREFCAPGVQLRERSPLPESGLDEPAKMVANWALLIPTIGQRQINSAIQRLNEKHGKQGVFFRISGPWPPFSFTPKLESDPEESK